MPPGTIWSGLRQDLAAPWTPFSKGNRRFPGPDFRIFFPSRGGSNCPHPMVFWGKRRFPGPVFFPNKRYFQGAEGRLLGADPECSGGSVCEKSEHSARRGPPNSRGMVAAETFITLPGNVQLWESCAEDLQQLAKQSYTISGKQWLSGTEPEVWRKFQPRTCRRRSAAPA